jgi:hypothetical protein
MTGIKSIGEYLTAVKRGIQNGDKIVESMWIAAQIKKGNETITEGAIAEIMRRKDICVQCPFNSANAKKAGTYNSSLPYEHCILCSCRIGGDDTKEYCLSCECGVSVWNKNHPPTQQMQVKWGPYDVTKETN